MPVHGHQNGLGALETRFEGVVTDDELLRYYAGFYEPDEPVCLELVDASDVTLMQVTSAGQRRLLGLASRHTDRIRGARVAMVAPTDVVFGMFRMWQSISDHLPYEVGVFRDRDEAVDWLLGQRA